MSLAERVETDLKQAMKAHDASVVETLRMLRASLKNLQIEKQREIEDAEIEAVIRTTLKQLGDARTSFVSGGRSDLVQKTDQEATVLAAYLPPAMSQSELQALVDKTVAVVGKDPKLFGRIMGEVIKASGGRADGGQVQTLVKAALET